MSIVWGAGGDDRLTTTGDREDYLNGELGNDTYVSNWVNPTGDFTHVVYITDTGGDDTLDLSTTYSDISELSFSAAGSSLEISGGTDFYYPNTLIVISDQFGGSQDTVIETLIIGDKSYDLTAGNSGAELNGIFNYGATSGNDVIKGTKWSEWISGLAGNDTLTSGGPNGSLYGGEGNDVLTGNSLYGEAGNDRLITGDEESASFDGGAGSDTYVVSWKEGFTNNLLFIYESSGADTLDVSAVASSLDDLSLSDGGWVDYQDDDLRLYVRGADGEFGSEIIIPGFFDTAKDGKLETLLVGGQAYDLSSATSVEDVERLLFMGGGASDDRLTATDDRGVIRGYGGNDTLEAGATDNSLYGGEGDDHLVTGSQMFAELYGGAGSDTYVIGEENNSGLSFVHSIYEQWDHGDGSVDTLDLSAVADSIDDVSITSRDTETRIEILSTDSNSSSSRTILIQGSVEKLLIDGISHDLPVDEASKEISRTTLGATDSADTIEGGAEYARIYAFGGDDSISAGEAVQYLIGGDGDDSFSNAGQGYATMYGGAGNDTYKITSSDGQYGSYIEIHEFAASTDSNADTIDLSEIATGLEQIRFKAGWADNLLINVYDANQAVVATVHMNGDYDALGAMNVERLVIGDTVFDLTAAPTPEGLEALRQTIAPITASSVVGGSGDDRLSALEGDDTLLGEGGVDQLVGGVGDNLLSGGAGDDLLYGADGADVLSGGAGSDHMEGGSGTDQIWAGVGDDAGDLIFGEAGADTIGGGAGDDTITGDIMEHTSYVDRAADYKADLVFGGAGNDLIITGGWQSLVFDQDGRAEEVEGIFRDGYEITETTDENIVWAGSGDDSVYGTDGHEILGGGTGGDIIKAAGGHDKIYAGQGHYTDQIFAGSGRDTVFGGGGNDSIDGGDHDDLLYNGDGNDTVLGGKGDDTLWGGSGDDQLTGGEGRDVFAFAPGNGRDTVTDFLAQDDKLNLSGFGISDLSAIAEAKTQDGKQGVLLTFDASTNVFLEGLITTDLNNDLLVVDT